MTLKATMTCEIHTCAICGGAGCSICNETGEYITNVVRTQPKPQPKPVPVGIKFNHIATKPAPDDDTPKLLLFVNGGFKVMRRVVLSIGKPYWDDGDYGYAADEDIAAWADLPAPAKLLAKVQP